MLRNLYWDNTISDVNILADNFVNNMSKSLDKICPIKVKKVPEQYANKKSVNQESLECIRETDQRYTAATVSNTNEDWEIYKKKRNEVTSLLRRQQ